MLAKSNEVNNENPVSSLKIAQMRKEIDCIDEELAKLLSRRLEIARALGNLKTELNLPVKDRRREAAVIERVEKVARSAKTGETGSELEAHLKEIYKAILSVSCIIQSEGKS